MNLKKPQDTPGRPWWRIIGIALLAMVVVGAAGLYVLRQKFPPQTMLDIRAGIAARDARDPKERLGIYLEKRYGTQDDPANRDKVFVDFFNLEHIKAMQLMVRHTPEDQRQSNIDAMADWVETYRESLTEQDRARLQEQFSTDQGRSMLRQATAQYNQQDVQYRGQTAPVISELLKTIKTLQKQ